MNLLNPAIKSPVYAYDIFICCTYSALVSSRDKLQYALRSIALWYRYCKLFLRSDECHEINLSKRFGDCDSSVSVLAMNWLNDPTKSIPLSFRKHTEFFRRKTFNKFYIFKGWPRKFVVISLSIFSVLVLHRPQLYREWEYSSQHGVWYSFQAM